VRSLGVVVLVAVLAGLGCAAPVTRAGTSPEGGRAFRVSDLAGRGESSRRAATNLLLEGLDEDAAGRPDRALALYQRSLQLEPRNPYAYLVLARHHADGEQPQRGLSFLDQAETLFDSQGGAPPGVEVHLEGLRGAALAGAGRASEAASLLDGARRRAPSVWGDGRLSPQELR
jgi:tetratricopeptide (TPR) repeat protein